MSSLAHLKARPPFGKMTRSEFEGRPPTRSPRTWVSGLRRIAREHPFDLVHAQHYGGATRAYFACRRFGWPLVYEIHSLLGDEYERQRLGRGLSFRFYMNIERRVCRHAAAVIALGEPVKRWSSRKGSRPTAFPVIYPGIDLGEYERPSEPAAIPGVGPEHKVVMYVGSIVHPNQGVPVLIESLPRVFEAIARGPLRPGGRPRRRRRGVPGPARPPRRPADRPDRPDSRAGRRPDPPRRRPGPPPSRLPRELLGAEQDRRLPRLGPSHRGDRLRRLHHDPRPTGAGAPHPSGPEPLADGIIKFSTTHPGRTPERRHTSVAEEYFGMSRNIDRYIDVYKQSPEPGPALSGAARIRSYTCDLWISGDRPLAPDNQVTTSHPSSPASAVFHEFKPKVGKSPRPDYNFEAEVMRRRINLSRRYYARYGLP